MKRLTDILQSGIDRIKCSLPFNKTLLERSAQVAEEYNLERWFRKIPPMRPYHSGAVRAVKNIMHKGSVVLETGCGIGQTFVMLSRYGYKDFIGIEKNSATYHAAYKFLSLYGIKARLFNDDGLNALKHISEDSIDVYLPLNWAHETPQLESVFDIGYKVLRPGGLMIIDIIRDDFKPYYKKEIIIYAMYRYKRSVKEIRDLAVRKRFNILGLDERYGSRFNIYLKKGK